MKKAIRIGSIFVGLGVVLGALGAHALENVLSESGIDSFETAVRYQIIHGLAVILTGIVEDLQFSKWLRRARFCFILGTLFFSGSIYLLVFKSQLGLTSVTSILGPITPIGGTLLIVGWGMMVISTFDGSQKDKL